LFIECFRRRQRGGDIAGLFAIQGITHVIQQDSNFAVSIVKKKQKEKKLSPNLNRSEKKKKKKKKRATRWGPVGYGPAAVGQKP
jgi:hypothetical protein